MKKLFITFLLLIGLTSFTKAQDQYFVWFDTLGNLQQPPKSADWQIPSGGVVDSIVVGLWSRGEIDIDTVNIYGGFTPVAPNANVGKVSGIAFASKRFNLIGGQVTTVNLADGATSLVAVDTLYTADLGIYNTLRFGIVTGASGNDKTDTNQGAGIIIKVYRKD